MRRFRNTNTLCRLAPANREYRVNAGMAQLLHGDFRQGWRNYASRVAPAVTGARLWNGRASEGKQHSSSQRAGSGRHDSVHPVRTSTWTLRAAACMRIVPRSRGASRIRDWCGAGGPRDQTPPSCDWYAPLLHLPAVFGTRVGTIPADVPYLSADPDRVRNWGAWIRWRHTGESDLRVGIVWRGGPDHWNDRNRSMDPSCLAVLAGPVRGEFFSLQKGYRAGMRRARVCPAAARPRQLRGHGRPDGPSGSGDLGGYFGRASCRRTGPARLGAAAVRSRLAVDARTRRLTLVSRHEAVSPAAPRGMAYRLFEQVREALAEPYPAAEDERRCCGSLRCRFTVAVQNSARHSDGRVCGCRTVTVRERQRELVSL